MASIAKKLAKVLRNPEGYARRRQAVIGTYDAGTDTVSLTLGGDTTLLTGIDYLGSYTPLAGETVWVSQVGSDLLVLGAQGAHAVASPPSVRVQRNVVGASIGDSSDTPLPWHETAYDYGNMWTSGTDVDIPLDGIYDIKAGAGFVAHANGRRILTLYKNTTAIDRVEPAAPTTGGFSPTYDWVGNVSTEIDCVVGDAIQCKVYQTSGGGLALSSFVFPWMTVSWVRPLTGS